MNLQRYSLRESDITPDIRRLIENKKRQSMEMYNLKETDCLLYGINGRTKEALECDREKDKIIKDLEIWLDNFYREYARKLGRIS